MHTNKEQLQAESDLLHLAIEVAFRQKLLNLLTDPNADPNLLVELLKLNEKREAQKLKERQADLKERDQDSFGERRMALDERELAYREKRFAFQAEQIERARAKEEAAGINRTVPVVAPASPTAPHKRAPSNTDH